MTSTETRWPGIKKTNHPKKEIIRAKISLQRFQILKLPDKDYNLTIFTMFKEIKEDLEITTGRRNPDQKIKKNTIVIEIDNSLNRASWRKNYEPGNRSEHILQNEHGETKWLKEKRIT